MMKSAGTITARSARYAPRRAGSDPWAGRLAPSPTRSKRAISGADRREISETEWGPLVDELWPRDWLPIADDGGPLELTLGLSRGTARPRAHRSWDDPKYSAQPRTASLADMVDGWIELIEDPEHSTFGAFWHCRIFS